MGSTTTAADGTYSITDLGSGNYDVEFSGGCGYPGNVGQQWYDNQISQSSASVVTVTTGSTTSVNAALAIGGTITGIRDGGHRGRRPGWHLRERLRGR